MWPLVGLAAFVLAIGAMLVIVFTRASGNPILVALAVSIATAVVAPGLTALGVTLWQRSRWPDSTSSTGDAGAADVLAGAVRELWRIEAAERRRLSAPPPIPIRWEWTRLPVTGSVDEAIDAASGPGRPGTLPGVRPAVAATVKEGGLSDLFAVYGGLSSGRVILLGDPGTGKSAAILLLLDALDHRRRLAEDVRATVPVPVLLTPHDWDPSQRLVDWLAARIVADFPVFRMHGYGPETARRLVRGGRIALFLDGFDELEPGLRIEMLHALNALPDLRLVLLSCGPQLAPALIVGLGAGLSAGVGTGIAAGATAQRTRPGRRRPGTGAMLWAALRSGLPAGLAAGLPAGLVTGIPAGLAYGTPAGISNGLVVGLGFVVAFALIDGLTTIPVETTAAASPISDWRQDRRYSALVGIIFGIALGVAAGFTDGLTSASHDPLNVAVPVGAITGLVVGATGAIGAMITVSRTWSVRLLFGQLWLRGATPVRVMRFLPDAYRLGVLRVAVPVYQFRHARLQDRLASESD